ncbi:flagellar biosynthetic protein FliO [Erwinia amylovora]|uniref:flagellar biosynthetic protein FliO n=1 Tax=Erwinia amylovora TaxID=552 RepID=UPI000C074152|nr:flagellar biosynthetic protein FliO [Erwinia amylovora]MBZ2400005.1 flagellar biosynthetic protein FliO [Erwinia amylovora]MBZ2403152.1 flagellar biosynthetic protein FliO [Erwinia amylovora]
MKTSSSIIHSVPTGGPPASDSVLLTVSGALALIVLFMVALAWLARRSCITRRFNDGNSLITVVATKSLGTRERVVVIDVEDRRLVLGVTATQIACLDRMEKPADAEPEMQARPVADFPALLSKLRHKYGKGGDR